MAQRLNIKGEVGLIMARAQVVVGLKTILLATDKGDYKLTLPKDKFHFIDHGDIVCVSIAVVQPGLVEIPDIETPGLILPGR